MSRKKAEKELLKKLDRDEYIRLLRSVTVILIAKLILEITPNRISCAADINKLVAGYLSLKVAELKRIILGNDHANADKQRKKMRDLLGLFSGYPKQPREHSKEELLFVCCLSESFSTRIKKTSTFSFLRKHLELYYKIFIDNDAETGEFQSLMLLYDKDMQAKLSNLYLLLMKELDLDEGKPSKSKVDNAAEIKSESDEGDVQGTVDEPQEMTLQSTESDVPEVRLLGNSEIGLTDLLAFYNTRSELRSIMSFDYNQILIYIAIRIRQNPDNLLSMINNGRTTVSEVISKYEATHRS